jgi:hypothetical protein
MQSHANKEGTTPKSNSYAVAAYDSRNPRGNESLESAAARFAAMPARLSELNKARITELRRHYAGLTDAQWFDAIAGAYQNAEMVPGTICPHL